MNTKWWCTAVALLMSTASFAATDSTRTSAPVTPTSYYPDLTSTPPTIRNADYSSLDQCPPTIVASNCDDINRTPGSSPASCPDACKVTRVPETIPTGDGGRAIGTITDAVCPTGYSQVATFNMQNEVTYQANPPPVRPIYDINKYWAWYYGGWSCSTYGTEYTSPKYDYGAFTDGQITFYMDGAEGIVVKVRNSFRDGCFDPNLKTPKSCSVHPNSSYWRYRYSYMMCTPPAGLYVTGNTMPVSLVCARPKPTWRTLNPEPKPQKPLKPGAGKVLDALTPPSP